MHCICLFYSYSLLFFSLSLSLSVAQTGVKWRDLCSLQPLPPGFKRFLCLSLLRSWDYRLALPHLANFYIFSGDNFIMLARLMSNYWPQVIHPPRCPKVMRLRGWATTPGPYSLFFQPRIPPISRLHLLFFSIALICWMSHNLDLFDCFLCII